MGIIQEIEGSSDARTREDDFPVLMKEISVHSDAEEKVVYPALQSEIPDMIRTAIDEHNQVRRMLSDLDSSPKNQDSWIAKIGELRSAIQTHVTKEEGPVFDTARKMFSDDALADMARSFQDAKTASPSASRAATSAMGAGREGRPSRTG